MWPRNILNHCYSKYKQLDKVINNSLEKKDVLDIEPPIKLKPKSVSFYREHNTIRPYQDVPYDITEPREVPEFMHNEEEELNPIVNNVTPVGAKLAKVGIWGPTNSGKSMLMNAMIGRSISAVSNKSFTSDSIIKGINTDVNAKTQLILYDLPGFTISSRQKTSAEYLNMAYKCFQEESLSKILFVVDSTKIPSPDVAAQLENTYNKHFYKFSSLLVVNKMDLCFNRRKLMDLISFFEGSINFEKKFYTSALTGFGVEEIVGYLRKEAQPGVWVYKPDIKTSLSELDIAQELVKSCIYDRFFKEFPYELQFEIIEFLIRSDCVQLHIKLNCERPIHKAIIVGKDGKNLTILRNYIETQLAKSYARKVQVELSVMSGLKQNEEVVDAKDKNNLLARTEINTLKKFGSIDSIIKKKR